MWCVSSDTFDIALDVASPATIALLVIFLRPPPEVSTAKNTSSFATVDISDKSLYCYRVKVCPSATSKLPAVFVPIVMSSPATVKSPVILSVSKTTYVFIRISITAFDADTVPAVIPSTSKLSSSSAVVDVTPSSIFNSAPWQ